MDNKEIGSRIKKRRKELKLTQKELALKIGMAEVSIQQYERGVRCPNLQTRILIANALNCPYGDLFIEEDFAGFDTAEDFETWRKKNQQDGYRNGFNQIAVHHHSDGTVSNEIKHVPPRLDFSDLPGLTEVEMKELQNYIDFLSFKRSKNSNSDK